MAAPAKTAPTRLAAWLRRMQGRHVAILGDAMLDEFLWGDATRISPEAPVPVVLLERQTSSLGGAANVAANVASLGGRALLFSVVGNDAAGQRLGELALEAGIAGSALEVIAGRPTTVKHRVFARNKHLLRFDREATEAIPAAVTRSLLRRLEAQPRLDVVIVSDYAKGCVTSALARGVAALCARRGIPWCVDPKHTSIRYRDATVLKPNQLELAALSGLPTGTLEQIRRAAAVALRRQGCRHLLVTRGANGMTLFAAAGGEQTLAGGRHAVADVTGAGDTVSAALGLALGAGLELPVAATIANLAAGYVVTLPGTAAVRARDLLNS